MKQICSLFYLYIGVLTNQNAERHTCLTSDLTGDLFSSALKANVSLYTANMLCEITDETVPWEVNQQRNLMNAIFSQVVKKCCGCKKVDHPSQRRHECLMMSKEEGWITYRLVAIEHVVEKGIL